MKLRFVAVVFAATFVMLAAVGSPAQVYVQTPDFNAAWSSQNDTSINGFGLFAQVYDNFTLASTTNLSSVEWTGSYFNPVHSQMTGWTLQFYGDSGNQPGGLLYQTQVAGTAGETFLRFDFVGNPTFQYGLGISFTAAAGAQYSLSVYPDLAFPQNWGWETSSEGDGLAYQDFFGMRTQASDVSFALFAGTSTPETGTLVMLGTGVLALAGTLRRTRQYPERNILGTWDSANRP